MVNFPDGQVRKPCNTQKSSPRRVKKVRLGWFISDEDFENYQVYSSSEDEDFTDAAPERPPTPSNPVFRPLTLEDVYRFKCHYTRDIHNLTKDASTDSPPVLLRSDECPPTPSDPVFRPTLMEDVYGYSNCSNIKAKPESPSRNFPIDEIFKKEVKIIKAKAFRDESSKVGSKKAAVRTKIKKQKPVSRVAWLKKFNQRIK